LDQCAVCGMKVVDAVTGLCASHSGVYGRVKDVYSLWFDAYGKITREDFLKRLIALPETGERAKEMAKFLIRNFERWK
jgi:hypothetical protein